MDSVRRVKDQFEHQQNETLEERRTYGSHWGAEPGQQGHQTATGAAAAAVFGNQHRSDADPIVSADHAVDPRRTEGYVPESRQGGTVGVGNGPQVQSTTGELQVQCGPLLNYRRMADANTENPIWVGSVLVVTNPGQRQPELNLRCLGPASSSMDGPGSNSTDTTGHMDSQNSGSRPRTIYGTKMYEDPRKAFWQFDLDLPFQPFEANWEYSIPRFRHLSGASSSSQATKIFTVPSKAQSMRIMFHSCNGFSVGTDVDAWSGPALWNDVLRMHSAQPFHVMIGGGDQIYNDGVRVDGPLRQWTDIKNPKKRRDYPFNEELRARCDEYYFDNYVRWYSAEPFATANGQIPQLNIWDDHDIIDGFGSYTDHFMKCAVFRGIGGVAHKYYMLFQHHLPPPKSTFTTDAPKTWHANGIEGTPADPIQTKDTFVMTMKKEDPSYILGLKPGPYVEERSRSMYCQLGARIAFLGIDARQERTRHQVNYPETYNLIFNRVSNEIRASNGAIKHLILLLGVPIAYPRLQWLENLFSSPIIGPIRFLNKRFGVGGGFFNTFDGNVDLLDDLDDHYTSHAHKHERRELVLRLQALAREQSVRISILGGDVHLAAIGRFYSNPKLEIPAERDFRYMPNIISSAITNKPPPAAVANLLARRNKIHHLDHDTDETLVHFFDRDPGIQQNGVAKKTADSNHCTMPSRNYAIIAESATNTLNPPNGINGALPNGHTPNGTAAFTTTSNIKKDPRDALHAGEEHAGTAHPAASGLSPSGLGGPHGLDVAIRVEITPSDREGRTEGGV
ncbi:hypothetical protein LTR04_004105 [Oleoguttula sp. CCFEE 6159]|nr:hypothetical protein LTR04_004105 [Oleoguttula sp. CCFEE 6159]